MDRIDEPTKATIIHQLPGCQVIQKSSSTVIKQGSRVSLDEQSALDLAAQLNLSVPRVHRAGHFEKGTFLEMGYIVGDRLDLQWPDMTADEKQIVCQDMRNILTTMRGAAWTCGRIGSCSGGQVRDDRQYNLYTGGPFADERTFNSEFYLDLLHSTPRSIRRALLRQVRDDHRIVFSHGDLAQHNILVRDGRIAGLLDWEHAGWYPEHWDYVKFFERPCKGDWREWADEIFPQPYDDELACHQAILRWQKP